MAGDHHLEIQKVISKYQDDKKASQMKNFNSDTETIRERLFELFKENLLKYLTIVQFHVNISLASPELQSMLISLATPYHMRILL